MDELPRIIAAIAVPTAIVVPLVLRIVFRHQRDMAIIQAQTLPNPQLSADVQELKQQVADMRELMIDIALQPNSSVAMQKLREEIKH